uniref:Uncharacterized protein n=1 Tax=Strongyloides stercoralis TaxID=6248 RepID=A0A0K0EG46_STRER
MAIFLEINSKFFPNKKYSGEDNEKNNVENQIIVPIFERPSPIINDRTFKKCRNFSCNKNKKESLEGNQVLRGKRKRNLQQSLVRESTSKEEKDEISKILIFKPSKDYMTVMSRNFHGNRRIEGTSSLPYFNSGSNKENENCNVSNSNQQSSSADIEIIWDSRFPTSTSSSLNEDQSKKSDQSNKRLKLIKSLEYTIIKTGNQKL